MEPKEISYKKALVEPSQPATKENEKKKVSSPTSSKAEEADVVFEALLSSDLVEQASEDVQKHDAQNSILTPGKMLTDSVQKGNWKLQAFLSRITNRKFARWNGK